MAKRKKKTRQYIQLSRTAVKSILDGIDVFNRVHGEYRVETTLMLLTNAWELLAKAVLVKQKRNIYRNKQRTQTISCEDAINALFQNKGIDESQAQLLQQMISLRNSCMHGVLPFVPESIQHHIFFYACKFFKELSKKNFSELSNRLNKNFLTISFDQLTTYAAQVQTMVSRMRRGANDNREIVWLLERGVRYVDQNKYISQKDFENLYKNKKKILPHLKIGDHIDSVDMVCIVPVQAPQNFTADITLRKAGKNLKGSLPVTIKKTNIEEDFPYLTKDISEKIGKNQSFVAKAIIKLNLKGNIDYHQSIRTGKSSIHRYSARTLDLLQMKLKEDPQYNPYK